MSVSYNIMINFLILCSVENGRTMTTGDISSIALSGTIIIVIAVVGTFIPTMVITALVVVMIMNFTCK